MYGNEMYEFFGRDAFFVAWMTRVVFGRSNISGLRGRLSQRTPWYTLGETAVRCGTPTAESP